MKKCINVGREKIKTEIKKLNGDFSSGKME
jgi:hypothetical protein